MRIEVIDLYKGEYDKAYLYVNQDKRKEFLYLDFLNGSLMLDIYGKNIMEKFQMDMKLII